MPRTLWRYILMDLVRSVCLTTAVLVTVIAFGAALKPLATDNLLTAGQTAKYITLAIVPMLQFALPFAAGFAGTLLLHRLANDNEIQAMAASGLGYGRILAPVAGLGLVLALIMVVLTQWMIPHFWGLMTRTIATDLIQIFQTSIDRGTPFQVGDLQVYADRMRVVDAPEGSDADSQLQLLRVVAAELDGEGRIATDVSAAQAVVDIYRREGVIYLHLVMVDVTYRKSTGEIGGAPSLKLPPYPLENRLRDDPASMTRGQLLRLRADPDGYAPVRQARNDLEGVIRQSRINSMIDEVLRERGQIELINADDPDLVFRVSASGLDDQRFLPAGGDNSIEIVKRIGVEDQWIAQASGAVIRWGDDPALEGHTIGLELEAYTVRDLTTNDPATPRARKLIPNLVPRGLSLPPRMERPSGELLALTSGSEGQPPRVAQARARLEGEIGWLERRIRSKIASRYAHALTAPLLLLLGAVLALVLRQSLPLTVYLWAFLPSIVDLIVIAGGRHMVTDGDVMGIPVMWSGNVALVGILIVAFFRLRRN